MAKSKKTKSPTKAERLKAERLEAAGKFIRAKIQEYIDDGGELARQTWGIEVQPLSKEVMSDYGINSEDYDLAIIEEDEAKCGLGALLHVVELSPAQRAEAIELGDYSVEFLSSLATGLTKDEAEEFTQGFDTGVTDTAAQKLGHEIALEFLGPERICGNCGAIV